jgi:hypothetical protein
MKPEIVENLREHGLRGSETPYLINEKIRAFLDDVAAVMEKHGMSIAHEDSQGGFIIQDLSDFNLGCLLGASDETRMQDELK